MDLKRISELEKCKIRFLPTPFKVQQRGHNEFIQRSDHLRFDVDRPLGNVLLDSYMGSKSAD
ncbi:MAG: hypothetical protein WD824_22500 [Cyclobacteriaceae bacterium]